MSDFSLSLRESCGAFSNALYALYGPPGNPGLDEITFEMEPPVDGSFRWYAVLNRKRTLIAIFDCCHPPFGRLHDWLERAVEFDCRGKLCTEMATLDCSGYSISIFMEQAGWGKNSARATPSSVLAVCRTGCDHPFFYCHCLALGTLKNMYSSMMDGLLAYEPAFEDISRWPESRSVKFRSGTSIARHYRRILQSGIMEKIHA